MATKKKHSVMMISILVIGIIVLFVVGLLMIIRFTQTSYSHKISSITFSSNTGPVSPGFQSTQTLVLTTNSCQYTVTKVQPASTTTTACKIGTDGFNNIETSFNTYGVADKIQAQSGSTDQKLIGGKTQMITIELQDGTMLSTEVNRQFLDSVEPFISEVELNAPQFSSLDFSQ